MSRILYSKIKNQFIEYQKNLFFRAFIYSLLAFLVIRFFSSLVMLIGLIHPSPAPPFSGITEEIFNQLNQKDLFTRLFIAPWYRWDTAHYLMIADFGYDYDFNKTIWPPLYPFLIKLTSFIIQPSLVAAIFVSNLFSITGFFLTFKLSQEMFDEQIAKNTLFFLVIFPTSFFFVAAYTESLFLTLSVAVFLSIKRKKWLLAGLLSALAALTRVQGLLLVLAILTELLIDYSKTRNLKYLLVNAISCLYAPFAYGLYSLYVFFGLKTDWPWSVLSSEWEQHFGFPWEGIFGSIRVFYLKSIYNDYPGPVYLMNVFFALLAIYLLIVIRKRIPISLSIYSWAMMILILGKIDINNALVSTIRYLIPIFPIFIAQAFFIKKKLKLLYAAFCIGLQVLLLVVFYWWLWVG